MEKPDPQQEPTDHRELLARCARALAALVAALEGGHGPVATRDLATGARMLLREVTIAIGNEVQHG